MREALPTMKYRNLQCCFTYSMTQRPARTQVRCPVLALKLYCELRGRQRQVGSLAGAAHLLNDNTGVLR